MTTEKIDPTSAPDYDRIAAEMMQQWQQQFLQPVIKPEFTEALGKSGAVAQNLMEMGQVLWQSWLQGNAEASPASADDLSPQSAYAAADVPAAAPPAAVPNDAPAAAAAPAGVTPAAAPSLQPDTTAAASMASVALCAELARRLDLLANRVARLEQQLEEQRANK